MNQLCCSRYGIQSLGGGLHRFSSKPSFVQEYEAFAMCFTLSAARGIPDLYDAPAPRSNTGGAWAPPRKRYANECTEKRIWLGLYYVLSAIGVPSFRGRPHRMNKILRTRHCSSFLIPYTELVRHFTGGYAEYGYTHWEALPTQRGEIVFSVNA